MPAAIPTRRLLVAFGLLAFAATFSAFVVLETPGLGIGHFYYVAIALLALATGPRLGAFAGAFAGVLYATGAVLNPAVPSAQVMTIGTLIRATTYVTVGILIGFFARRNRELAERLAILADRDFLTGLPNTRAFERSIAVRFDANVPFALLLGATEMLGGIEDDDALRRIAEMLRGALGPNDELARVGNTEFAVLAACRTSDEAARLSDRSETALAAEGLSIVFGWSLYPREGKNALSLYRAADERLHARRLISGRGLGNAVPLTQAARRQ